MDPDAMKCVFMIVFVQRVYLLEFGIPVGPWIASTSFIIDLADIWVSVPKERTCDKKWVIDYLEIIFNIHSFHIAN